MNNKRDISNIELFSTIFLILIGTTAIYGIGDKAFQDAWIVVVITVVIYLSFIPIYFSIIKKYPKLRWTQILEVVFGKVIGKSLILLYALYFSYISARNLADILHFSQIYILEDTPNYFIIFVILMVTGYALYIGIDYILKVSKYVVYILISFYMILIFILVFNHLITNNLNIDYLTPVLENGWNPILESTSINLTFPFGELIVVFMFIRLFKKNKVFRTFSTSVILVSVFITLFVILTLLKMGPNIYNVTIFKIIPLGTGIKIPTINRIESLLINMVVLGGYFKHLIMAYGGLTAFRDLFSIKSDKLIIVPLLTAIAISSIIMNQDATHNLLFGLNVIPYYIHYPMQFGIPIILFIVSYIKHNFIKKNNEYKTH